MKVIYGSAFGSLAFRGISGFRSVGHGMSVDAPLGWTNDAGLCQLAVLDDLTASTSYGKVKTKLQDSCQDPEWGYEEGFCDKVFQELFKNHEAHDVFNTASCEEVRALVNEHWKHQDQVSVTLLQRSRDGQSKHTSFDQAIGGKASDGLLLQEQDELSHSDSWCQADVLSRLPRTSSYEKVSTELLVACLESRAYSKNLCMEVTSELFKDVRDNTVFQETVSDCDDVHGLLDEHEQHQTSVLLRRSQETEELLQFEEMHDFESKVTKASVDQTTQGKKPRCQKGLRKKCRDSNGFTKCTCMKR